MDNVAYRLTELERRLANMLRIGTVDQLDEATAKVRVRSGDLLTGWLSWFTRRAGGDTDWWAPEPGEQVMVLSPNGDPAQGIVLPAIYQDAHPAPAMAKTVRRIEFVDGTFIEYDRGNGKLRADVQGSLDASATVSATVTSPQVKIVASGKVINETPLTECTGNLSVTGNITSTGNIQSAGEIIDSVGSMSTNRQIYNSHTHPGASGGTTGTPNETQ